jgi:Uma2 family endonuclease
MATGSVPTVSAIRYVRAPRPLHFPEEELVPESKRHLVLRTFLFQLLQYALGPGHSVGSDQFVYWNAASPRRCLAPDVFVKRGVPDSSFGSWKTWERGGPPDLAIEITSPSDSETIDWEEKLARYYECGVAELVRFDPEERPGSRLRAWDRVKEDLVERIVADERTPCLTLEGTLWGVTSILTEPIGLRLVDPDGRVIPSALEAEAAAREAEKAAFEARIADLESQLRRKDGR